MTPYFFNTLTRQIESLKPIIPGQVSLYTCGPTVYNYAHIGNLRTYIFEDILRRTLERFGFKVNHVMNITDVGHLESDADVGDDKMALASQREKKSPWDIARYYEEAFLKDCAALNLQKPTLICRATEHIQEMQAMVQKLIDKDLAYVVDGNVYFRISKFPDYAKLSKRNLDELLEGARVDIDNRKESPLDFVLWFSQSKFPNQIMQWDSPWGRGFPGWHIECSAMAAKYLGEHIDIHCGGVDHVSVHHSNEIAQSEGCFGHQWVNTWMHGEFLVLDKGKMSKSSGSFLTIKSLEEHGFEPLHYRYFCLGAHYRSQLFFSFEALEGARNAFESLKNRVISWKLDPQKGTHPEKATDYLKRFNEALANDLDMPIALSILWEMVKDAELGGKAQLELITQFDQILGLGVERFQKVELSPELLDLVKERENARTLKDWAKSDELRKELLGRGICLKDSPAGTDWYLKY
ncbi:MAG: cysteine--tRNA ligase [Myxococcaceae bacterium]